MVPLYNVVLLLYDLEFMNHLRLLFCSFPKKMLYSTDQTHFSVVGMVNEVTREYAWYLCLKRLKQVFRNTLLSPLQNQKCLLQILLTY